MSETTVSRTLVKSPPELWAELSDPEALASHLEAFGEIRITRTEPESAVAWEGERARGHVALEPAGWGTRVTLTAEAVGDEAESAVEAAPAEAEPVAEAEPAAEPEPEPAAEPVAETEPVAEPEPQSAADDAPRNGERRRRGLLARLRLWRRTGPADEAAPPTPEPEPPAAEEQAPQADGTAEAEVPPEPEPEPEIQPEPGTPSLPDAEEVLTAALDRLGTARHRPYSRP